MKRNLLITSVILIVAFAICGCGNTDAKYDPYQYVTSETLDSIKSGTALDLTVTPPEVTDEEVQSDIDSKLTSLNETVTVSDRPVKDGDTVNIDFVGTLDGVAFDGGTAEGYELTIGSGSFIEGFESGLIGASVGTPLDLDLTFPEDYGSADLAGKSVVFNVTVNSIQETKTFDLTDETAKKLDESVNNVEEYRALIKENLTASRRESYESNISTYALSDILEKSEFKELPEDLINVKKAALDSNMQFYAQMYGTTLEDMIVSQFGSQEAYDEYNAESALKSAQEDILVNALAKALGLKASYKEIKSYAEENAGNTQKPSEYIKSAGGQSAVAAVIIRQKVLDYLGEHSVLSSL